MADIKEQLSQLNKMSKRSVALYHGFAVQIGVSDSALGVLYALFEADVPCSQQELCSEWFIPKQTVNTAVSALQKKGLVSLVQVSGAKNKKNITLTDEGREFAKKTVSRLRYAELTALSELSAEERELFVTLNKKYNDALTKKIGAFRAEKGDSNDT